MEYVLYASTDEIINVIGEKILRILKNDVIFGNAEILDEEENELSLYCDMFTLQIDNSSDSIKVISEESNIDLKVELYMNLDMQCEDVIKKTIYFVGKYLKEFSCDIILMSNGDVPIILRNSEKLIVDTSRVKKGFPFEVLQTEYVVDKIKFLSDWFYWLLAIKEFSCARFRYEVPRHM